MHIRRAIITSLPAAFLTIFAFLPSKAGREPWGAQFAVLVAFMLSFVGGYRNSLRKKGLMTDLVTLLITWVVSVAGWIFLTLLDIPRCVGLDNGDGVDTLDMCLAYTVIGGLLLPILSSPVFLITILLLARDAKKMVPRDVVEQPQGADATG